MRYIDLNDDVSRQIIVDKEEGQYLGHVTTVLLEDQKTMIAVYPKGHGRGGIIQKMSFDAGLTWSERMQLPDSFETSMEVPTIYRTYDANGKKRLILFSGLYPIRMAVSEDDGYTWSDLQPILDYNGIVAMGDCIPLDRPGKYMAMFHDEGVPRSGDEKSWYTFYRYTAGEKKKFVRYLQLKNEDGSYGERTVEYRSGDMDVPEENGELIYETKLGAPNPVRDFHLSKIISYDGGLTWSQPQVIYHDTRIHLCEPGMIRLNDGSIAILLRENARVKHSHIIFSYDEGATFTAPVELPDCLTGDRHTCRRLHDGRIAITFRDMGLESETAGDWVMWVGTDEDLKNQTEGQYKFRLKDNFTTSWIGDCGYPGLQILPDDTIVAVTYGHWREWENGKNQPYILEVRLNLKEFDEE